jgi:hypothetical protein
MNDPNHYKEEPLKKHCCTDLGIQPLQKHSCNDSGIQPLQKHICTDSGIHSEVPLQKHYCTDSGIHSEEPLQKHYCTDLGIHSEEPLQKHNCTDLGIHSEEPLQKHSCIDSGIHSNKPFSTLRLDEIKSKMPFIFQLIVGSKQMHQTKPQQVLIDAWLSNTVSGHGPNSHESSCASQLAACAKYFKSHKTSCVFQFSSTFQVSQTPSFMGCLWNIGVFIRCFNL